MPRISVKRAKGAKSIVNAAIGSNLLDLIKSSGIDEIIAMCGGQCTCATCHIYIDPKFSDYISKISSNEHAILETIRNRNDNSRLACQIFFIREIDLIELEIASAK